MTDLSSWILRTDSIPGVQSPEFDGTAVFEAAHENGVHLLVAQRLRRGGNADSWPPALRARFEEALRDELATEPIARHELRDVMTALHAEHVDAVLFKGAALAFTHYTDPVLRPRIDVDLLVRPDQARTAATTLERMGYRHATCIGGEMLSARLDDGDIARYLASSQASYDKVDRYGVQHTVDVHWKVSIPQVFANLFPIDELLVRSLPVPALGDAARSVGSVDALAIACIHRVAHHHASDRLIWLYDIHLLASTLTQAEAGDFVRLADRKQITAICAAALSQAQERLGTNLPTGLLEGLKGAERRKPPEPSATYLRRELRKIDVLGSDLAALPTWPRRLRLLAEHLFPPAGYMKKVYGTSARALLPMLYAWRIVEGARGWFRSAKAGDVG